MCACLCAGLVPCRERCMVNGSGVYYTFCRQASCPATATSAKPVPVCPPLEWPYSKSVVHALYVFNPPVLYHDLAAIQCQAMQVFFSSRQRAANSWSNCCRCSKMALPAHAQDAERY